MYTNELIMSDKKRIVTVKSKTQITEIHESLNFKLHQVTRAHTCKPPPIPYHKSKLPLKSVPYLCCELK